MGNITAIIVVCAVCGFLILCLLFLYKRLKNKSSNSKLDKEINRYKNMNKGEYDNSQTDTNNKKAKNERKIEVKQQKAKNKTLKLQDKLNTKVNIENLEGQESIDNSDEDLKELYNETNPKNGYENHEIDNQKSENVFNEDFDESFFKQKNSKNKNLNRDEDFDKFMDEFSYSRVPKNKSILEQIDKLPPKTKAIVLNNIFNKFDD